MTVLQDIIDRWHANHPDWPATAASGHPAPGSSVESHDAETLHLVLSPGAVVPVPQFPARTKLSRIRQAAARIGIDAAAYWYHLSLGKRWCSGHRDWHPAGAFYARSGYHRDTLCKDWRRADKRVRYARGRAS